MIPIPSRSSLSLPKLAAALVLPVIALLLTPQQVQAVVNFSLNPNGDSHIGWMFTGGSSWDNKNATYNGVTKDWHTVSGSYAHGGVDYYADDWNWGSGADDCGKDVVAPFAGNVIYAGWSTNANGTTPTGYGYVVVIQADANDNFAWRAAHLEQGSLTGASHVNAGDYIGKVGNTSGTDSFPCHLHSVLYKNIKSNTTYGQTALYRLDTWGSVVGATSGGPDGTFAAPFYNDGNTGGGGGTDCNNVGSYNGVRLYDQDKCNGSSRNFGSPTSGIYNLDSDPNNNWNDRAASIYVGSGWSVRIYEHNGGGGKQRCVTNNLWNLDEDPYEGGGIIGSSISSVIVYNNNSCTGGSTGPDHPVQFYTEGDYKPDGVYCFVDSAGTYNICSDWNEKTSSVLLKSGWSVRVFEHANGLGGHKCYTGNDANMGGDYFDNGLEVNDKISSFALYNQSSCPSLVPNAPSLSSPADGATFNAGQEVTLQWTATATEYEVEVWGGPAGTTTYPWQTGTSKNIGTQWPGYTYYWHVRAKNSSGTSGWSSTRSFKVNEAADTTLPTGKMTSPAKESVQYGPIVKLVASASDDKSGVAKVEFFAWSNDPWSGQNWIYLGNGSYSSQSQKYEFNWNVSGLGAETGAFVTIKVMDNAGNYTDLIWDPDWTHFSIKNTPNPPAAPELLTPEEGLLIPYGANVHFTWTDTGDNFYGEVWNNSGFKQTFGWQSQTSKDLNSFPGTGLYYWRVRASNAGGEGPWSPENAFHLTSTHDCSKETGSSVKLFSDYDCSGASKTLSTGFTNLTDFNDLTDSIYVPSGKSVRVWRDANRGGSTLCVSGSLDTLNYFEDGSGAGNSVTSAEVFNNTSCTPPVVSGCAGVTGAGVKLFTATNCGGSVKSFASRVFAKLNATYNNKVTSVYVAPGWSVKLYKNKTKLGGAKCFAVTKTSLAGLKYSNGAAIVVNGVSTVSAVDVYQNTQCKN